MFFHISLEHEICLHPKYFGPQLLETVPAITARAGNSK